jgi:phosphotransferase system enzyme I (PtsI)
MTKVQEEIVLRGSSISKGIGIGFPIFVAGSDTVPTSVLTGYREVEEEIHRYRRALDLSRQDLEKLHETSVQGGPAEIVAILGTHLEIMKDPLITTDIERKIRDTQQNTESIFHHLIEEYKHRFNSLQDSYFQERIRDVVDISQRILGHLRPIPRLKMSDIPHNTVILAYELVPSETIEANASLVSGFVTATGGLTSHAAIIARAKGIPYVANIDIRVLQLTPLHSLIVDGGLGMVILNPTKETLKKYQGLKKEELAEGRRLKKKVRLKGETIDGYEVRIFANLDNPEDIEPTLRHGAMGVGLFRSEYLCLSKQQFPTEEEQFEIYKKMVKSLRGKPLVIRVFDLGGDKKFGLDQTELEPNPALGCRAIRFLMRHPSILDAQLRAILRASRFGEVHVLVPMVSDISELCFVRKKIAALQIELRAEGHKVAETIRLGCMIEVPSSALMCDVIAQEADFLSIGTNDLIQFVLAADRANPYTSDLYSAAHPSVLRMLRMIVSFATAAHKPVVVCGEIAANPLLIPILLGFGISEFSVAARHIPLVKDTVRKWRLLEACKFAEKALHYPSADALKEYLIAEGQKP